MAVVNNPKLYNNPADKSAIKTEVIATNFEKSDLEWENMLKKLRDDSEAIKSEDKVEIKIEIEDTKVVVSNTGVEISTEVPITLEADPICRTLERTLEDEGLYEQETEVEKQAVPSTDKPSKKYGKKKK